jgi:cytochrome c oxidase cbb3-type subunit 2
MAETDLGYEDVAEHMRTLRIVGVPYTDEQIAEALNDVATQANGENGDPDALQQRYPKAVVGDFDGDPSRVTELDALVAYLQMLGTLVDFTDYNPELDYR